VPRVTKLKSFLLKLFKITESLVHIHIYVTVVTVIYVVLVTVYGICN